MTVQGVDQQWRVGPVVGIGTLLKVDRRHRARPGGYLFDQLGIIADFSEGIFRLWDENLYSA